MVLIVILLIFTTLGPLQPWEIVEESHLDLFERWGITRVKRHQDKLKERFPESTVLVCDMLHMTEDTPFVAIILYKTSGRLLCMGSIIDRNHILTAKRCFERTEIDDVLVMAGYYRAYWGRHAQVIKARRIVRHEYEAAILRLAKPLVFCDYVQAVRLPSSVTRNEHDFKKAYPPPYQIVGFTVDRFDVPGDFIEKDKTYRIKEDNFVPFDECKKNYSKVLLEPPRLFCTYGNATYCWGGWGAPVLKWFKNSYYLQVGVIVSDNCTADTTGPYLAIRTDAYADWIRGNSYHGRQPS